MSKCRDLDPLFAPYADGDVPAGERASVEAHLAKCPPCRDRVAEQQTVRAALTATRASLRGCAPAELRQRCAAQAGASGTRAPVRRGAFIRRWVPLSVAATIVLAIVGVFLFSPNKRVDALATQLTLDHMTCFQFAPERLQHSDASSAEHRWLEKQRWGIHVPESSTSNRLELLGVRQCGMGGGRVAHILYKWRGEPLSLFIVPRAVLGTRPQDPVDKFGHEAVIWSDHDCTYVVLARAGREELEPVVQYVRTHAQ